MSEPFWNVPYDAALFEELALGGDWLAQVTVLTRHNVDPGILGMILNRPELHESVQLAITERRDVTVEQLEFLAQRTESAVVINRIIQNRTVPLELIEAIRDNARTLEGKVWYEVVEHADRVLASRRQAPKD